MIATRDNRDEILKQFQVDVFGSTITISLKNGSTLKLEPVIENAEVVDYEAEYLTGKENKDIRKLQQKIAELHEKIDGIKQGGEDEEDIEDVEDVEEVEEKLDEDESEE